MLINLGSLGRYGRCNHSEFLLLYRYLIATYLWKHLSSQSQLMMFFESSCWKPKEGRIKGGKWGWLGSGGVVGGKWRQLYLNNKNIWEKKRKQLLDLNLPYMGTPPAEQGKVLAQTGRSWRVSVLRFCAYVFLRQLKVQLRALETVNHHNN